MTIEKGIGAGVPVVASEYPVAWNVQVEHDDPGLVRSVNRLPATVRTLNSIHA
jgi:hypothetical protein